MVINTKFNGGNFLTPEKDKLMYYIHNMMMINELSNGQKAYQISNAKLANSGPSFGPFQYDLGSNKQARILFEKIANSTKNNYGLNILNSTELSYIKNHFYKPFKNFTTHEKQEFNKMQDKINQVLSSDNGQKIINQDYLKYLKIKALKVELIINNVTNPENKQRLINNLEMQLIIADTRNQFGTKVNAALVDFLNKSQDQHIVMPYSKKQVSVEDYITPADLIKFKFSTIYGLKYPNDTQRRLLNIKDITFTNPNKNYHIKNLDENNNEKTEEITKIERIETIDTRCIKNNYAITSLMINKIKVLDNLSDKIWHLLPIKLDIKDSNYIFVKQNLTDILPNFSNFSNQQQINIVDEYLKIKNQEKIEQIFHKQNSIQNAPELKLDILEERKKDRII